MVLDMGLEPRVLAAIADNGVTLTAVSLCDPLSRRLSSSRVSEQPLERFSAEDDIAFAYNTQRSFSNAVEGKSATGRGMPLNNPPAKVGI